MITIRPSQLKLYSHCPGSYWLQQEVGEQPATEAMQRGTDIHEAIKWAAHCAGVRVHSEFRRSPEVRAYDDLAKELWNEYVYSEFRDEIHVEDRLTLHAKHFALSGQPDVVCVDTINTSDGDRHATIIDWKTGGGYFVDPPERNLQMMGYAVLAMDAYRVDTVLVRIVFVDKRLYSDQTQRWWRKDIEERLHYTIQEIGDSVAFNKDYRPGFHCNEICNLRAHCPAWKAQAQELVKIEHNLPVTKEQIEKAAVLLPAAKKYLETVEEAVKAWVDVNGPIEHDGREYAKSTYMKFPELRMSLKNECDTLDEETRLKVREVLKGMEQVEVTKYNWRKKRAE